MTTRQEPLNIPDDEFILLYLQDLQERGVTHGFKSPDELGRALINWFIRGKKPTDPRMVNVMGDFTRFLRLLDTTPTMTKRDKSIIFFDQSKSSEQIPEELLTPEIVERRLEFRADTRTPII